VSTRQHRSISAQVVSTAAPQQHARTTAARRAPQPHAAQAHVSTPDTTRTEPPERRSARSGGGEARAFGAASRTSFEKLVPQHVVMTASTKTEWLSGSMSCMPYEPPNVGGATGGGGGAGVLGAPVASAAPVSAAPSASAAPPLSAAADASVAPPPSALRSVVPPPLGSRASRRWSGTRLTSTAVLRPTSAPSSYTSPVCALDSSSTKTSRPLTMWLSRTMAARSSAIGICGPSKCTVCCAVDDLNLYSTLDMAATRSSLHRRQSVRSLGRGQLSLPTPLGTHPL
jgi:hypothetical protein